MRTGVFGGTFDPIHLGHLIIAEQCCIQANLDRVLFIPAPRPPHKAHKEAANFASRVEMIKLAIVGNQKFVIDTCEQDRPGLSYTVDTLNYLRNRDRGHAWFLILGGDSIRDFESWRQPRDIARMAKILIVDRPGVESVPIPEYCQYQLIVSPLIAISSTEIRERVKRGMSLRYLIPDAVEGYIRNQGLYLT
ncbi:MAG TPA: nicotinate-nucleotide adenylyltransferase [Gemmatales bacterium]|nr:nicotinate-nucleotide adenylyltransferase [Gemmatales bacterium]HMP17454.1 nicotinate-nucleotide adenylyltransferase [Gemmatales bacterium]